MARRIAGHPFVDMVFEEHKAAIQVTLNQLEAVGLKSPYAMARTTMAKTDQADIKGKELRETLQRTWDKGRSTRADLYAEYLRNIHVGKINGSAPPPTLYTPTMVTETDDGEINLPFQSGLIAIDGETQLEARFRLRSEMVETGDAPFAAILHFGIEPDFAMQILHDYNRYAKPIPESKLGARNASGGLSATVNEALEIAGYRQEDLNVRGATGNKDTIAGFIQAMHFVAGCALGPVKGIKLNAASYFDELNRPGAPPINGACPQELASMLKMAATAEGMPFRKLAAPGWQVAGVTAAEGRKIETLNWPKAFEVDKATARHGRGGSTGARVERRERFYAALIDTEGASASE